MNAQPAVSSPPTLSHLLGQARIPGLDFLRAVAVLLVLVNHSGEYALGPLLLANGGIGVEVFFVLSGFLISSMLMDELSETHRINFRAFYQRRAARLLPVFYAYLLVGLAYLALRHKPIPWGAVWSSSVYVLNYYQAFTGAPTHFLSHCWSLAVEEQFYVLWPIVLILLYRRRWPLARTMAVLISLIWLYRATLTLTGAAPDEYLYRALDTRADHLLMGCLLAALLKQQRWQIRFENLARNPVALPALVLALMVSGSMHGVMAYKYVLGYAIEPVLIALAIPLVILKAGQAGTLAASVINSRAAVLTGQASYGVYLFHQLAMHPIRNAVENVTHSEALSVPISIVSVVFLAYFSFRWFENPLRQRWRPRAPSP
jgi:peptidoglycan/LPS O-acetylase OafA/YrhL